MNFTKFFVVKCILEQDKKILLLKEGPKTTWKPGRWSLPGGKYEPKETFEDALKRELDEETGLEAQIKQLLEIEEIVAKVNTEERLVHHMVFSVDKISGELRNPDENVTELRWFSQEELAKIPVNRYAEFYYKDLFDRYFKGRFNKEIPIRVWNTWTNNAFAEWIE